MRDGSGENDLPLALHAALDLFTFHVSAALHIAGDVIPAADIVPAVDRTADASGTGDVIPAVDIAGDIPDAGDVVPALPDIAVDLLTFDVSVPRNIAVDVGVAVHMAENLDLEVSLCRFVSFTRKGHIDPTILVGRLQDFLSQCPENPDRVVVIPRQRGAKVVMDLFFARPNNSSMLIAKTSASIGNRSISGQHWADSHLDTA